MVEEKKEGRAKELLRLAAEEFAEMRNPFGDDFLVRNNVTADECFHLSNNIAIILNGYLYSTPETQQVVAILGAAGGMVDAHRIESEVLMQSIGREIAIRSRKEVLDGGTGGGVQDT